MSSYVPQAYVLLSPSSRPVPVPAVSLSFSLVATGVGKAAGKRVCSLFRLVLVRSWMVPAPLPVGFLSDLLAATHGGNVARESVRAPWHGVPVSLPVVWLSFSQAATDVGKAAGKSAWALGAGQCQAGAHPDQARPRRMRRFGRSPLETRVDLHVVVRPGCQRSHWAD